MKLLPADIIPPPWLRLVACLFATFITVSDLRPQCPPEAEITLPTNTLEARTKTVPGVCLQYWRSFAVNDDNKRYLVTRTDYEYSWSKTNTYTQGGTQYQDTFYYYRKRRKTEVWRGPGTTTTTIIDGSGRGREVRNVKVSGQWKPYEKNSFDFKETETGIKGTYTHQIANTCGVGGWTTTTQPYTSIWPQHFPESGFVENPSSKTSNNLTYIRSWTANLATSSAPTDSGYKKETVTRTEEDSFQKALKRAGDGTWTPWEPLDDARWGIPNPNDVICIPSGILCEVRALFKGCPATYEARLYLFEKNFPDTDDVWPTPSTEGAPVTFTITKENAATGVSVKFTLPLKEGKAYKVDTSKPVMIRRVTPAGQAGGKICPPSKLASAHFDLSLGRTLDGENAGHIGFHTENLTADSFTPAALSYQIYADDGSVDLHKGADGVVDEVYTLDADVKIESITDGFVVKFYSPVFEGTKFVDLTSSWQFKRVSPGSNSQIEIKRLVGGTETQVFGQSSTGWSLARDGIIEALDTSTPNVEIRTTKGAGTGDPIVFKEKKTYDLGTAGQRRLIELVRYADSNTPAEVTTWHYYSGSDLLEYVDYPDGGWRRYTYDADGEIFQEIGPWLDSLRTDTALAHHRYNQTDRDQITISGALVNRITRVEYITGQEVGRTYKLVWDSPVTLSDPDTGDTIETRQVWEVQVRAPGLAWDATGNYITKSNYNLSVGESAGELWRAIQPDGTTTYLTRTLTASGGCITTERVRGGSRPATNSISETNATGSVVFEETTDNVIENNAYLVSIGHNVPPGEENLLSNRVISSKIATTFENNDPERGRPTTYVYLDGSFESIGYACCGRITYYRDRNGLEMNYVYDSRGLLVEELRGSSLAHYPYYIPLGANYNTYDAAGRLVQVDRASDYSSGRVMKSQTGYDLAGRIIWTKDALNRQTTYSYTTASGGGSICTKTRQADGATNIETLHRDGQTLNVGGTAVPPRKYLYGINSQGRRWRQETLVGESQSESEWVKTYTDMLGRIVKEEYPDSAASTYAYSSDTYGTSSNLEAHTITDPDGVATAGGTSDVYMIAEHILPINAYGEIPLSVSVHRTIKDGTYTDISLDGLRTWITDTNGLTTTMETELISDPESTPDRTVTTKLPDGTSVVRAYFAGQLFSEIRKDSTGGTLSELSYYYDKHGRLLSVSQVGTGSTTYSYHDDGQIASVTGPDPDTGRSGPGYDPQTTSYGYDDVGRLSLVTHPDGTEVHTSYWPTGTVKRSWGSRTYPSEYSYDTQGRFKTLTTWKDFAAQTGAAVTTWNYHAQRGWLTSKVYEGGTAGPSYTYWPSGRLKTRAWARGLTTTYNYDNAWGKLSGVSYSDGTTPSVAYTYTTDGKRLKTIQDASGTLTYDYRYSTVEIGDVFYHPDGSLTQETYAGGLLGSRVLSHNVDSLGRPGGVTVTAGGTTQLSFAWQYDTAGRLQTITQGTTSASLGYNAYTEALESISVKQSGTVRLATNRTIDAIGRISAVSFDNPSPGLLADRTYAYNAANQRTEIVHEDAQRWAYGYDALGQVNLAEKRLSNGNVLPGYAFALDYDDIGNRKTVTTNGRNSQYVTDPLNRYQSRGTPLWVDVRGKALSQIVSGDEKVKVLVNDELATRTGEDFYLAVPVTSLTEAPLKIQAARPSPEQAVTENRTVLVPAAPEAFVYDADGNLTQDGLWNYEWDGENRLKAQELRSDVTTSIWKRLEYAYDGQDRRIQKVVKSKTSAGGTWTTGSDTRFVYDGWNLVAEYSYGASTFTLLRSHAWGRDLSGTAQGAGGTAGLLWTTVAATPAKTYAAAADANGNIIAYVDVADGTIAGRRDYGAFGEAVTTTGIAGSLPFGFSTKFEEKESGLYYYGFRFYNPGIGRWASRDMIEERGGKNLYGMVGNNAVNLTDVLGLTTADIRIQESPKPGYHFTAEGYDLAGTMIGVVGSSFPKNYVGSALMPSASNFRKLSGAGTAAYGISAELTESVSVAWPAGKLPNIVKLGPSGEVRLKISTRNAICGAVKLSWTGVSVSGSSPIRYAVFKGSTSEGVQIAGFKQAVNGSGGVYNLTYHTNSGPFQLTLPGLSSWTDVGIVELGHQFFVERPDTINARATLRVSVSAL